MTTPVDIPAGLNGRCFWCCLWQCARCSPPCTHVHVKHRSYPEPEDQSAEEKR